MHETIWHSIIVAFTIIIQKLDLTFNSFASGWAALCESGESKHSIMFNKTKGRYQKNAHHVHHCVCLNLTISWFLGFAFSSVFVAFSNSTSLHIRQKHIFCWIRNGQNKCIRQLKCSSRYSKKNKLIVKMGFQS